MAVASSLPATGAAPSYVTATVAAQGDYRGVTLRHRVVITAPVDADGDGLIEIYDLTMLHNMRYNLAGTSYKDASDAVGLTTGCPDANPGDGATTEDCIGYELMSDLDFDTDGDGDGTWTGSGGTYTLDTGDTQATYFDTASGGWEPIGVDNNAPFTAIFEGNGFVIRNLAIQRDQSFIGLFGATTGTLRNLGLEQALADKTGSSGANIGLLAGVNIAWRYHYQQLRHRGSRWRHLR